MNALVQKLRIHGTCKVMSHFQHKEKNLRQGVSIKLKDLMVAYVVYVIDKDKL